MRDSRLQWRLWWLLLVVAFAALDCLVFRLPLVGRPLPRIMILIGVIPMANVLIFGPLLSPRKHGAFNLPFWTGFEIVALLVLLFFMASTVHHSQDLRELIQGILRAIGTPVSLTFPAAAAVLLLPQLALAFLGGRLGEILSRLMARLAIPITPLWVLPDEARPELAPGSQRP
jgi:hypothetical protein